MEKKIIRTLNHLAKMKQPENQTCYKDKPHFKRLKGKYSETQSLTFEPKTKNSKNDPKSRR